MTATTRTGEIRNNVTGAVVDTFTGRVVARAGDFAIERCAFDGGDVVWSVGRAADLDAPLYVALTLADAKRVLAEYAA